MSLKFSFSISIFLYTIALTAMYLNNPTFEASNKIEIQKGAVGFISFVFSSRSEGMNQNVQSEQSTSTEGTIAEEVDKIRNKISYPAQALEDGLESECEWSIVIDENQKATHVKTVRSCQYKIFEEEFYRVIQDWKFNLPENTILQIPVSFKIR